jgi:hypothetical protein
MQYKYFVSVILITICGYHSYSQSLAINTDGSTANASAMLDVKSTSKGVLLPRMTSAERIAIASPATGLEMYDTNLNQFYYYNGSVWTGLATGANYWADAGGGDIFNNSPNVIICGNLAIKGGLNLWGPSTSSNFACPSDFRYKKNITPLSNNIQKLMQLQGVNYLWKQSEFPSMNFTDRLQVGFIAQDLEKIFPEMVFTDDKGYKSIDYSRLTPVLVETIKEQQKKIADITKRLEEIEKMMHKL